MPFEKKNSFFRLKDKKAIKSTAIYYIIINGCHCSFGGSIEPATTWHLVVIKCKLIVFILKCSRKNETDVRICLLWTLSSVHVCFYMHLFFNFFSLIKFVGIFNFQFLSSELAEIKVHFRHTTRSKRMNMNT